MLKYRSLNVEKILKESIHRKEKTSFSGIFQITVNEKIKFDIITINSDDTSVVDRFWNKNYRDFTLNKWCEWSTEKGIYIDIGAHTGIYTLSALKANTENRLITFEPFSLNFHRIISNLRLNNFDNNNVSLFNIAVTDENKIIKFNVNTPWSYLSKGGKISESGVDTKAIKLDSLKISNSNLQIKALKIDTEGEDFKVLQGAKNLITNNKPKLIVEVRKNNINEIIKFLTGLGYKNIYDEENIALNDNRLISFKDKKISKDIIFEFN